MANSRQKKKKKKNHCSSLGTRGLGFSALRLKQGDWEGESRCGEQTHRATKSKIGMLGLTTPGCSNAGILLVGVLQKVQQQQKLLSSIKFGGVCLHFGSLLPPPRELCRAKRWRGGYSASAIASGSAAASSMGNVQREKVGPGQESVWDYPRPPRLEAVPERVKIVFNSKVIADTTSAYRVLETSHPPGMYVCMYVRSRISSLLSPVSFVTVSVLAMVDDRFFVHAVL